jgi:hypothetical protein
MDKNGSDGPEAPLPLYPINGHHKAGSTDCFVPSAEGAFVRLS